MTPVVRNSLFFPILALISQILKKMVQIAGTYQHVETTNPELILKITGQEITDARLADLQSTDSKLVFTVNGDTYTRTSSIADKYKRESTFTLGKTFEEEFGGQKIQTTVTKNGDKLNFKSTTIAQSGGRVYEFTDAGVTCVISAEGAQAKRVYKRV